MMVFHTVIGASALLVILSLSLFGIYHPRINDGLIGRALYMVTAILCLGGLAHIQHDTIPRSILSWLLLMMACIMARELARERYGNIARSRWAMFVKAMRAKHNAKH